MDSNDIQVRKCVIPEGYAEKVYYRSRMKLYPDGGREIMYSLQPIFTPGSTAEESPKSRRKSKPQHDGNEAEKPCSVSGNPGTAKESSAGPTSANFDRARRRARAKVRDLALANHFQWFVTLTLDSAIVNRYDISSFGRVFTRWLDNAVRRRGLSYVIVPERHKDGAIHFHGLFNDALPMVNSGHTDAAGHPIFNCTAWKFGFSACVQIYGSYTQAVSYVCKYIGKQGEKPGGRWYYSGGKLEKPTILYGVCEDWETAQNVADAFGPLDAETYSFEIPETGNRIGIIRQNM